MIDPCWLPSAIMQTVGALYAIFIAIFVLTLQYMEKHDMSDYKIETVFIDLWRSKAPPIVKHFMHLTVIVAFTILSNGYFIYVLTTTEHEVEGIRYLLIPDIPQVAIHVPQFLLIAVLNIQKILVPYCSGTTYPISTWAASYLTFHASFLKNVTFNIFWLQ